MTRSACSRRGLTLVEVVVSLAAMGAIIVGLGAAIMVTARIVPSANDRTGTSLAAAEALDELMMDLEFATRITLAHPSGVRFFVPDRTNNGMEEELAYLWSGSPGQPLLRITNGGAPETILPQVRQFGLTYSADNGGGVVRVRATWASVQVQRESSWMHHGTRLLNAPEYAP
ncbi:MAG: hypothetical protein KF866_06795 [Phycisphaeraceae bacterium]|nr:hypothetical protein [Phycisphaeraceae bacterium]MCW5755439.1 hypothetical protein [Phycisphaeraceae bacterium]